MQHDRFKSRSLVHEAWRNGYSEAARPTALITGASRGIGRALAEEFAKNDHDLILIARNAADLENCAAELAETYSVAVRPLAVDLASPDAVETIVAFLNAHNLQVDVLINNAALWTAGPSYTCDTRDTDTVIATNTALPQALTRALVEPMIVRGYGALLNVGSLAGEMPSPGLAIYGASKSFLRYWTLSLRHELKTYNIHVSLLLPGLVNTDFTKGFSTNRWNTLRSILACRPETVAVAGYRGLLCNRAIVVPGGIARISYLALKF
ncbi:MAG: SDR family NAD(P)-dependent oxidoreductase, partial [Pseudomonadota bacterium]